MKFLEDVNPGVKAGFIAGLLYAGLLAVYAVCSISMVFPQLFKLASSLQPFIKGVPVIFVMAIAVAAGGLITFIIALIGCILAGGLHHWLCNKAGEEWSPLMAVFSGAVLVIALSFLLNFPPSKAATFLVLAIFSPAYIVTLHFTYKRSLLMLAKPIELSEMEKRLLRALRKGKLPILKIREEFGEDALAVLQRLEGKGLVKLTYDNAYKLTGKGKFVSKRL